MYRDIYGDCQKILCNTKYYVDINWEQLLYYLAKGKPVFLSQSFSFGFQEACLISSNIFRFVCEGFC